MTLARSLQIGIEPRDPNGEWVLHRVLYSLTLFVVFVLADGVRRAWPDPATRSVSALPRAAWARIRARWTPARIGFAWAGLASYHLTYVCYHNLKSWNALRPHKDALLTRLDEGLFLGHSPASLLHDLLGEGVSAHVLIFFYESFPTLVTISFVAAIVFCERLREGYVFIISMMLCWIFGVIAYYVFPTLGPWHQTPSDFAFPALRDSTVHATQLKYLGQRENFLADPQAPGAFAQIGAFASLHVGISTVIWRMTCYYRMRWVSRLLGVFVLITILATVYVGWHYVLDDVCGFAMACLAVWLGRRVIHPRTGRPKPVGSGSSGSSGSSVTVV